MAFRRRKAFCGWCGVELETDHVPFMIDSCGEQECDEGVGALEREAEDEELEAAREEIAGRYHH